jgi:hypothetical protein
VKPRTKFSLRSLLALITALAIILGLDARSKSLRALAAKHHYESMVAGYSASAIQKPIDPEWEWKYPTAVKWDRESVEAALPHWQRSTYHAGVRDLYLARARQPWLPVIGLPDEPTICELPSNNDEIKPWWKDRFGDYTETNPCFWDDIMGFSPEEPNCELTETLLSEKQLVSLSNHWYAKRKRIGSAP